MTEIYLRKLYNTFVPINQSSADAMDAMQMNGEFKAVLTKPRNIGFHKKLFALISIAYEAWTPEKMEYKGVAVQKNRTRFRHDLTVMAGFYTPTFKANGELVMVPKSISFAKMDEEEFSQLYSKFIDVILAQILTHYTAQDLDEQVNKILGFV